jgi:RNA polymerase sigma-70 factor (ECF subfamily)
MSNPNAASRFDEIYKSTSKAILAFITAKCRRTADISDIFQETYMELYQVLVRRGAEYIKDDNAFIFTIAKRKLNRYYTLHERFKNFVSLHAVSENEQEVELADFVIDSFSVEDFAVNSVLYESVKQYLQSKPEDVQKVFYLMYDVDLTISEIAQVLSISESNVKNKLYRTLKEIRKLLILQEKE